MYPVQRSVCPLTGDAALLEDEAAHKLLVDSHTPHRMRRVRINRHKLCGGVCGLGDVPRDRTSKNERFVLVLSIHSTFATSRCACGLTATLR